MKHIIKSIRMLFGGRRLLILLIPASLFLVAFRLQEQFTNLEAVLTWVVLGGGASAIIGAVMAYLLENWPDWHNLPRWVKVLFPIAMSGILGVVAQAAMAFDALAGIPPAVQAILLWLVNWFASQRTYRGIKEGAYADAARSAAEKKG